MPTLIAFVGMTVDHDKGSPMGEKSYVVRDRIPLSPSSDAIEVSLERQDT
jgi:hypothetical protein